MNIKQKNRLARVRLLTVYHLSRNGFTEEHIEELRKILKMLEGKRTWPKMTEGIWLGDNKGAVFIPIEKVFLMSFTSSDLLGFLYEEELQYNLPNTHLIKSVETTRKTKIYIS